MSGENDYLPGEAVFPASVTFVFGKDSLKLGAKKRLVLFLKQLWNGFTPSGIRLTYAWGNGLPVGSMYRLWEEETVFVVAGPEEAGKTISSTRRLGDDFRAAYGRPPNGPVTEVRVSARRPSREKGPVRASITVRFPPRRSEGTGLSRTGAPRWGPAATPCAPGRTRRRRRPRRRSRRRGTPRPGR